MAKKPHNSLKAQSLIEYSVLVIIFVMGLLATQGYMKRALQGRFKQALDNVGDQYDYWSTISDTYIYSESTTVTDTTMVGSPDSGWLRSEESATSVDGRYGNETITAY